MTGTTERGLGRKVGTVGVYMSGADLEFVRRARDLAGRVVVSGQAGRKAVTGLAGAGDLYGVDLDPASYLDRGVAAAQGTLFDVDWEGWQRDRGLALIRSAGVYVPQKDTNALVRAFTQRVGQGTVRVVSIHSWWLSSGLTKLLSHVRECEDPLAFVLAGCFDPLDGPAAVAGLRALVQLGGGDGRRMQLLRTDLAAIGFAAAGGELGTIGANTGTRHHGLPLGPRATKDYQQRNRSPYVFVPNLMSWHRGSELGALTPFDGAGITRCDCPVCGGDDLLRFDQTWPGQVPTAVRAEAQAHDLHCTVSLAQSVLASADPGLAWLEACRAAKKVADGIEAVYKVRLPVPDLITAWA